jgi:hypothetical protein
MKDLFPGIYCLDKSALGAGLNTRRILLHAGSGPSGALLVVVGRAAGPTAVGSRSGGRVIVASGRRCQSEGVEAHEGPRDRLGGRLGRGIEGARSLKRGRRINLVEIGITVAGRPPSRGDGHGSAIWQAKTLSCGGLSGRGQAVVRTGLLRRRVLRARGGGGWARNNVDSSHLVYPSALPSFTHIPLCLSIASLRAQSQ